MLIAALRAVWSSLRRRPAYAIPAIASLALGIGAVAAIVSVVDAVLLRELPYPEADRLVAVHEVDAQGRTMPLAEPNLIDLAQSQRSLAAVARLTGGRAVAATGNRSLRTGAYFVGPEFFAVLGVQPAFGRAFTSDAHAEDRRAAVVSHRYWREVLGASNALQGIQVRAFGETVPIVGVMPEGFGYPEGADVWFDARILEPYTLRTAHNWDAIARLAEGSSLADARAQADAIGRGLRTTHGEGVDLFSFALTPLREQIAAPVARGLWALLGAVAFLLLIAMGNSANLALAQALSRRRELAVRASLGASGGRLYLACVLEGLLLALIAAVLGVLLAQWGLSVMLLWVGDWLPRADEVALTLPSIAAVVAVATLCGLSTGLIAASAVTHQAVAAALSDGGRSGTVGTRSVRWRSALVIGQGAATVILLVGAGLLLRTFVGLLQVDPGFRTQGALIAALDFPEAYDEQGDARTAARIDAISAAVRGLPGVRAVGGVNALPLKGDGSDGSFFDEHAKFDDSATPLGYAEYRVAGPGYLGAMGIPLLRGRDIADSDRGNAPHVALISRSLAESVWRGRDPIGQRIQFGNMDGNLRVLTIIGVVGDVRDQALDRGASNTVYVSVLQRPRIAREFTLVVHSDQAAELANTLRNSLQAVAGDAAFEIGTIDAVYRDSLSARRLGLNILVAFSMVALALAVLGVYALVSFSVRQRSSEFAIRLALGSKPLQLLTMVLAQGLKLQTLALLFGLGGALALARVVESQLYGVRNTDLLTLTTVALLTLVVGLIACWVPAMRAARTKAQQVLLSGG